jgi:hypothetical protein
LFGKSFLLRKLKQCGQALEKINHVVAFNSTFIPGYIERMYVLFELASWDQLLEAAQRLHGISNETFDSTFVIALHELIKESPTNSVAEYVELIDSIILKKEPRSTELVLAICQPIVRLANRKSRSLII